MASTNKFASNVAVSWYGITFERLDSPLASRGMQFSLVGVHLRLRACLINVRYEKLAFSPAVRFAKPVSRK